SRREPCSQMSRKTRRGTRLVLAATALSASWALRVSWPSPMRMQATSLRLSSSSSTISMSYAIFNLLAIVSDITSLQCRQYDADHGLAPAVEILRRIVEFEAAAVVFDNLAHDREAKARALLASRHVRFEQPLTVFSWQSLAVVDDVDNNF